MLWPPAARGASVWRRQSSRALANLQRRQRQSSRVLANLQGRQLLESVGKLARPTAPVLEGVGKLARPTTPILENVSKRTITDPPDRQQPRGSVASARQDGHISTVISRGANENRRFPVGRARSAPQIHVFLALFQGGQGRILDAVSEKKLSASQSHACLIGFWQKTVVSLEDRHKRPPRVMVNVEGRSTHESN